MNITKIDLLHSQPVEDGWRPRVCRIYTDEGIYGDGEAALSFGNISNAAFGMMKDMAGMLIGMDPLDHELIWNTLYRECFWGINGGPVVYGAISCFDVAIWDIKGKFYNVPVYKLLGGKFRSGLRAYASQLQNGWPEARKHCATPEDYADVARMAVEKGFDAVKINFTTYREDGSRTPNTEQNPYLHPRFLHAIEERVKAVREVMGPNGDIILENHCYTSKESAAQMGNAVKKYGIMYFEEPTPPFADLLSYVHRETGLRVASGERMFSRSQFKERLDKEAIQVIQPDLATCGGYTEVKKICDMAETYGAAIQIHITGSPLINAASLHMEAAIPGFIIHEYNVNTMGPKMRSLAKNDYQPVNGAFTVPEIPGIGNELSDSAFETCEVVTVDSAEEKNW